MSNGQRNSGGRPPRGGGRGGPVGPRRRESTIRIQPEVAHRIRDGHPWIYEEALLGRRLTMGAGEAVDVVESSGEFVARALVDPDSALKLRVFSRDPEARLDAAGLHKVVSRAARWRRKELGIEPDGCMRVLNGDSEGIPAFNVDRYGDYLVGAVYAALAEPLVAPLTAALVDVWKPKGIYIQRRHTPPVPGRARPPGELVWGERAPTDVVVREGHARFVVDVSAPLGTGLFPDMRDGRQAVYARSGGSRVLNCFSYTGAFSVMALLGGAKEVVSVDSASRAHARARRNFSENGFRQLDDAVEFVTGDTSATLARFAERGRRFDIVVLDPPTFSSGGSGGSGTFAALKDYSQLASSAMAVLEEGGLLVAASNAAKLPGQDFDRALGRAAAFAGRRALITHRLGQPADYGVSPGFPEGCYLKIALCRVFKA